LPEYLQPTFHISKTNHLFMQKMLLSSLGTMVIGFLANKFLPAGSATWAVPAISAILGVVMKQSPKDGALSGLLGGGALGGVAGAMGDPGIGSILSSVLGGETAGGLLGSLLGGGLLGGAGGGIGGFLQGMLNKSQQAAS
jgi:hypothetical protein